MSSAANLQIGSAHFPESLETSHPIDVLRWAADRFGLDQLVVTASFKDAVLAHVAHSALPGIDIVLLDTQYLFAETQWFAEELRKQFDLNLRVVSPLAHVQPDNMWQTNADSCCQARKVEPLRRVLADKRAWVTGLRREDGPSRSHVRVAAFDIGNNVVKINPLAAWTDSEIALYSQLNDLPENPLTARGYPSIGCWPCTRPVAPGEDRRDGRWAGSNKTECGLHL
jgi:phosphoadenosine phosphosulfate reductase